MLTDVPVIDQKSLGRICRFAIRTSQNIIVLGPSGGGKTFIAVDAAEKEEARLIYINLAVLERTDFQGFPVVSLDKKLVSYATPEFLPFVDTSERDEAEALNKLLPLVTNAKKKGYESLIEEINIRLESLDKQKRARDICAAMQYLSEGAQKSLKVILGDIHNEIVDGRPIVILFDEVDKAATETNQTLLEFLQFRSINGRKLNIRACILTGNLPDEHAHTSHISHAITKRCQTYQLQLDFFQWREWAFGHAIHDLVIGFLTSDNGWLHKPAPDGDITAYALPSPRTWVDASTSLWALEKDDVFKGLAQKDFADLQQTIVAGSVGASAAVKFETWYKHYRKMDPIVEKLLENGQIPDVSKYGASEVFICALSACSRVYRELKPNNEARIKKYCKNVYKWVGNLSSDIQMGASRMAFGGDFDNVQKYKLAEVEEFSKVFKDIKKKMQDHNI